MHDVTPKVMVMPSDLPQLAVRILKLNLDLYMKNKSNGVAPASLNTQIFPTPAFEPPIVEEGTHAPRIKRLRNTLFPHRRLENQAGLPSRRSASVTERFACAAI